MSRLPPTPCARDSCPDIPDDAGGDARNDRMGRNRARHDRTRTRHRALTNCDTAQNHRAASNRSSSFHAAGDDPPVGVGLQPPINGGAGIAVVREENAMPDKHFLCNGDSFADECVGGNFAPGTHDGVLLDLHEGGDLGLVPNRAPVQIDELGMADHDISTQPHRRRRKQRTGDCSVLCPTTAAYLNRWHSRPCLPSVPRQDAQ